MDDEAENKSRDWFDVTRRIFSRTTEKWTNIYFNKRSYQRNWEKNNIFFWFEKYCQARQIKWIKIQNVMSLQLKSFTEIKLVIQLSTTCKHLRNENEDDKNEEGRSEYDLSAENETF